MSHDHWTVTFFGIYLSNDLLTSMSTVDEDGDNVIKLDGKAYKLDDGSHGAAEIEEALRALTGHNACAHVVNGSYYGWAVGEVVADSDGDLDFTGEQVIELIRSVLDDQAEILKKVPGQVDKFKMLTLECSE